MKNIKVKIGANGNVEILDAAGFGSGCQSATSKLESRLGLVDEGSRKQTDNFYIENEQGQIQTVE